MVFLNRQMNAVIPPPGGAVLPPSKNKPIYCQVCLINTIDVERDNKRSGN